MISIRVHNQGLDILCVATDFKGKAPLLVLLRPFALTGSDYASAETSSRFD